MARPIQTRGCTRNAGVVVVSLIRGLSGKVLLLAFLQAGFWQSIQPRSELTHRTSSSGCLWTSARAACHDVH